MLPIKGTRNPVFKAWAAFLHWNKLTKHQIYLVIWQFTLSWYYIQTCNSWKKIRQWGSSVKEKWMVCSILMFPSGSPNADNLLLRRKLYLMFHNKKIKNILLSEDCILNLSHSQLPHHLFRVALGPFCLKWNLPVT